MAQLARRIATAVRSPEFLTDAIQILKTVVAASAAWWLSVSVLDSTMPFLAPWSALLTVHATVYRSLSRGMETIVASAIGVGLSFVIGQLLGVSLWTFALALLLGLVGSRLSWIRHEGVAIATTAIFILGSGFSDQQPYLGERLIEVGLGVGVGVVANLLLLPPLRDQQASRYVDRLNRRMGDVLKNMADEFSQTWETDRAESWLVEAQSMDGELNSAWQSVQFARESSRMNPRQRIRPIQWRNAGPAGFDVGYEQILSRLGEGISHLRNLARTLQEGSYSDGEWDAQFRQRWSDIVGAAGEAIADPDGDVEPIYVRLDELAANFGGEPNAPRRGWPLYGALITGLRHIVVVVDDVASAREARDEN